MTVRRKKLGGSRRHRAPMRMGKSEFRRRLTTYAAVAAAGATAAAGASTAQATHIQYTDLIPNVIVGPNQSQTSATFQFDGVGSFRFDQSMIPTGTDEYLVQGVLRAGKKAGKKAGVAVGKKKAAKKVPGTTAQARRFTMGQMIGSNATFSQSAAIASQYLHDNTLGFRPVASYPNIYGQFVTPVFSYYAGVRFSSAGGEGVNFGWMHVRAMADPLGAFKVEIDGFAVESTPGQPIAAGATGAIPEPTHLGLLALGAAGVAALRARRRRQART